MSCQLAKATLTKQKMIEGYSFHEHVANSMQMLLHQNFFKFDQLKAEKWLNMWEGKNCQIGQIG